MIPSGVSHTCPPCEVGWRHHETIATCWNCQQPRPRANINDLFRTVGRYGPGWDGPTVTNGAT